MLLGTQWHSPLPWLALREVGAKGIPKLCRDESGFLERRRQLRPGSW